MISAKPRFLFMVCTIRNESPCHAMNQPNTTGAGTVNDPHPERCTLRHWPPSYPNLHCTKAIQLFGWRPDHPGLPPMAHAIGPFVARKRNARGIVTLRAAASLAKRNFHKCSLFIRVTPQLPSPPHLGEAFSPAVRRNGTHFAPVLLVL